MAIIAIVFIGLKYGTSLKDKKLHLCYHFCLSGIHYTQTKDVIETIPAFQQTDKTPPHTA